VENCQSIYLSGSLFFLLPTDTFLFRVLFIGPRTHISHRSYSPPISRSISISLVFFSICLPPDLFIYLPICQPRHIFLICIYIYTWRVGETYNFQSLVIFSPEPKNCLLPLSLVSTRFLPNHPITLPIPKHPWLMPLAIAAAPLMVRCQA